MLLTLFVCAPASVPAQQKDTEYEGAAALARRYAADSAREVAPLRRAEDAVDLDTTSMTFEDGVDWILERAKRALGR